jgi:UDP-glucose 4-epimerase
VNVDGTRVVAQASAAAGVKRLVFFSTIAVYGSTRPDEIADENTPTRADSLYGTSKRDAERVVLSTLASDGLPIGVVLRVAGIYGPRIKGNYRQLVRGLQRGWFLPVGDGRNRRTVVYHSDVAEAAILAGEHPAAPGNVFNVTDGEIHTLREILAAICAGLGRGPIRVYLPLAPVRVLARVVDAVVSVMGRGAVLEPMLTKMVEDMAVSGDKIRDVLGFSPRYELPVGWRETIPQLIQE